MKIAIVHEMLIKLGGAEKVLLEIMDMYPQADIYTFLYDQSKVGTVFPKDRICCDNPAQTLFALTKKPRMSLPLMPAAVKKLDLSDYDIVISSSSGFAHGVFTGGRTKHICYCHSPARYLWDWSEEVKKEIGVVLEPEKKYGFLEKMKGTLGKPVVDGLMNSLRAWDTKAAERPDIYIANSREVQNRIQLYYHRDSTIIWPPVDTHRFSPGSLPVSKRTFYVLTSALTPYKQIDRAIRVFTKLGITLKIIGEGAQREELQKIAGKTIEFLGRLSDAEQVKIYAEARGFIMPQKEDAGIAPIEAMAAGIPVFGLGQGGLLETNIDGVTGRFFREETDESFEKGFLEFHHEVESGKYDDSKALCEQAKQFDTEHFRNLFSEVVRRYI